ncbi:Potassium voltage-gated channel subfamily H member 7 (Ether-a-go-go-related gene potassium channel 3) (ERG-3) (Eag-related protein 3) (Ether-a-go-go-related protein 3) (hERG-3) (Voltage-gated potassium channel subunit Kv11.3), partial [Durusdinium trenchii]
DKTAFAILRGQKTKVFVMQKPWYVINPDNSVIATLWQIITTFALLFVALVTPIQVGLMDVQLNWLFVVSLLVDVVFFLDMLLQFFTTYARKTPRGSEWEVRLPKIILHYISTWFLIDLVTLIPFELFSFAFPGAALEELTIIKVIRVLRLLKLTRLLRSSRLVQRMEAPMSLPYQKLALLKCVGTLALLCHWLACTWSILIQLAAPGIPTWIDDIAAEDAKFGIDTRKEPWRIYVAAFYFCSYTMTSVGYGDIGPKNVLERTVCTIFVLGAGLSWACVLGEVCAIVAEMNAESQEFRRKMHNLNKMMSDQGLPSELRLRLRGFFLQNRHQTVFTTHQRLLMNMSPQLRSEVCTAVNLVWIQK